MAESRRSVNIPLGDQMSEFFYEATKLTRANRPGMLDTLGDSFGGAVTIDGGYFADEDIRSLRFGHELDGISTKVYVRERLNEHFGSAQDLAAMTIDDASAKGGEVLSIDTGIDVRELNEESDVIIGGMRALAQGLVYAAELANVVAMTGEIAELGGRVRGYGDFNYNWSGVAFYAALKERRLTGKDIQPGQALVGLADPGFRSNGWTDVRNTLEEHYGADWHLQVEPLLGALTLGEVVQIPAVIYSKLITNLHGGFRRSVEPKAHLTGVAHITGGGQPSKIGRMLALAPGVGVTIDRPLPPPAAMLHVQKLAGFTDRTAYGKWHMGPGEVVFTTEPEKVKAEAAELGIIAEEIGETTDEPGIRIKNMGAIGEAEWLKF